jgi:hypothetical protein
MELHRTRGPGVGDLVTLVRKPKLNATPPDRVHRELESAPQSLRGSAFTIVGAVILVLALSIIGFVLLL